MASRPLTPENYYRLPWNLADNAITWLEPTTRCNIYCDGCYRENDPAGDRPMESVIEELQVLKRLRKTDGISIAGGEPLLYPHIVELVRYVTSQGWKPIIISNGTLLTPELIRELKDAGLVSFTIHIDSHQKRPDWTGKNEEELNELRLHLARMIHEAGGGQIACGFNATIYRDNLKDIPALTKWAEDNIDVVNTMVYILFRSAKSQANFEAFAQGKIVDPSQLVYQLDSKEDHVDVMTEEVVEKIREASPEYEPCAFLSGTEDTRALKWLIGMRVGNKEKILSYMDSKFSEFVQIAHHFLFGTYLAYTRPCLMRRSQVIFPLSVFSKGARKVLGKWVLHPYKWFKPLHMQTILIIQPVDVFADGRISMCDGCPDAMLYNGKFVWKCRVDELQKFGGYIQCIPWDKSAD